jgi:hypothetical protein
MGGLHALYPAIIDAIGVFVRQLTETHGDSFAVAANQHTFKTYLFKSRGGTLVEADLEKNLNTPAKVRELATVLGMAF